MNRTQTAPILKRARSFVEFPSSFQENRKQAFFLSRYYYVSEKRQNKGVMKKPGEIQIPVNWHKLLRSSTKGNEYLLKLLLSDQHRFHIVYLLFFFLE